MKLIPKRVAHIRATWIYPETNEFSFFRETEDSIQISANRMDFELWCTHGSEPTFEAMIVESQGILRLRFDGYEGPEDHLLRKTESPNEIILCHESMKQVIYIHLTTG